METFNPLYSCYSQQLRNITSLGVYATRWNNFSHDMHPSQQKFYCQLESGEKAILKCEYSSDSLLIAVHEDAPFKRLGKPAPQLTLPVLKAIQTTFPNAEIIGEQSFIRIIINRGD